jgi:hypothetical protein
LAPKEGNPILDQQKSIVMKPTKFELKTLAMSSCEDASYLKEVQEALKDNPFIENITNVTSSGYTTQNNSNAPQFIYGWTFWLHQNHGIDIKRFLVATNVEIFKEIYPIV